MPISFHGGHSGNYCDHAEGKLEDIICNAIEQGFTHYGLSEHMPRTQTEYLYPEECERGRTPEQLERMFALYIQEGRQLQYKYKEQIHILVGMETELIGTNFDEIEHFYHKYSPDYLVGSVHYVNQIPSDYSESDFEKLEQLLGGTEAVFCAYYDAQFELLQRIRPQVVGHFDLIRLFRPEFSLSAKIWEKIERNLTCAISYDALVEINARAFKKKQREPYPQYKILQMLISLGGKVTLGDDSHHPKEVGLNYEKVFKFLKEQGISSLYALEKDEQGCLFHTKIPVS
ncbi:MAG: histidinol-phosphatase [SAR324 cluster bacterium]|nr:histidinol-phosphatase [SAR324 cluster bacterium]